MFVLGDVVFVSFFEGLLSMLDISLFGNEDIELILEERDCGFKSLVYVLNFLVCDVDDKFWDFFKFIILGWRYWNKLEL